MTRLLPKSTIHLALSFAVIVLLAMTSTWFSTASAQQPVPIISLGFEESVVPGQTIAVSAYLVDPLGSPIYNAPISFGYDIEFLNVSDSVDIGTAVTDETGLALLTWEPRSEGSINITATFEGNEVFAPATGASPLEVLPGGQLYRELPPYRIPGANVWLTTGLITTVWVIFIGSLALVGWANFKTRNTPHSRDILENGAAEGD
jgi:hypothetical protein